MPFIFKKLAIPDVTVVQPRVFGDERGSFVEIYKASEFARHGIDKPFVQFNLSVSKRNVLRGLHYQLGPAAQGKLVRIAVGSIYDVVVDIRSDSSTFGQWVSEVLSAEQGNMLYAPEGFAHGFCVLSEAAHVQYCATAEYTPDKERGIVWNDSDLAIDWPVIEPVLSDKDKEYPVFKKAEL
ncbi:MAG: dTDP-4-dehydrorhamnose 3,5-epimerase [bacterium]